MTSTTRTSPPARTSAPTSGPARSSGRPTGSRPTGSRRDSSRPDDRRGARSRNGRPQPSSDTARPSGPTGGLRLVKVDRPVLASRPGRPVVLAEPAATVTSASGPDCRTLSGRTVKVDQAAATLLAGLDAELRWMSTSGALAQQLADDMGLGRWPTSSRRSLSVYGTVVSDDVAAQVRAEPARAVVWVDHADVVADRRAELEALCATTSTPLLVVAVEDRFGPRHAAEVAAFLAQH